MQENHDEEHNILELVLHTRRGTPRTKVLRKERGTWKRHRGLGRQAA